MDCIRQPSNGLVACSDKANCVSVKRLPNRRQFDNLAQSHRSSRERSDHRHCFLHHRTAADLCHRRQFDIRTDRVVAIRPLGKSESAQGRIRCAPYSCALVPVCRLGLASARDPRPDPDAGRRSTRCIAVLVGRIMVRASLRELLNLTHPHNDG